MFRAYLHGIGGRLIGAQLLIVVMAVGGFSLAIISFQQLDRVFGVVIDRRVPVMTAALALARDGERLNASAPVLAAAATDQQRDTAFQAITHDLAALKDRLQELRRFDVAAASVDRVEARTRQLENNLSHINTLVADGLKAGQAAQGLLTDMVTARDAMQADIGPAIAASSMRIALDSKTIREHASQDDVDDLVNALAESRPMLALQAGMQLATDALISTSASKSKDTVDQLALKFRGAMKTARAALKELPDVLRGHLQGSYNEIARIGDAATGLPAVRSGQIDLLEQSRTLIEETKKITDGMSEQIASLSEATKADIQQSSTVSRDLLTERTALLQLGSASVVLLSLLISFLFVGRRIVRPLSELIDVMGKLAGGETVSAIPGLGRRDEVGAMAGAVRVFQQHMATAARLAREQEAERDRAAAEKQAALVHMADTIEAEASRAMAHVSERSAEMAATAEEMRGSAARTGDAAGYAATAASQALANAQTVASAAEQLSASINEIGTQVTRSTSVVGRAVEASGQTRHSIEALIGQVASIGSVADMIGEIASRTNLLALNATIEAARAGEAGRGFAVVASEVKALAGQTARSTQEITQRLAEIRAATDASVAAVGGIEQAITEVNTIAGSIAAAVEEQGAATAEIARNVAQTATAVNEVTGRIGEVSEEAGGTDRRADHVQANTAALAEAVGELRHSVVRAVRTSTAEVDRRASPRLAVDMPCRVDSAGQAEQMARVVDLSEGGARIAGGPPLPVGASGTLVLEAVGTPLPFSVRAAPDGMLGVAFALDAAAAERLRSVLGRLGERRAA